MKNTPPLGPAPTPARPVAPDLPRKRVLRAVATLGEGGAVSVADVATEVGGHPNTARHHLRALAEDGLVVGEPRSTATRGRPAIRYAVSEAGRGALASRAAEADAGHYLALAGAFADRLASRGGDPGADSRAVGRAWAGILTGASTASAGGEAAGGQPRGEVIGLLDRLGFSPEDTGGEDFVLLRTCPLLDSARAHPQVVCQVHAGLVAGAEEAHGGSGDGVVLEPFAVPGACRLTLSPTR